MSYFPTVAPPITTLEEFKRYMDAELRKISQEMTETTALELRPVFAAPLRPREGMIIYADGTSWNPGSGEGPYVYKNGAWVIMI